MRIFLFLSLLLFFHVSLPAGAFAANTAGQNITVNINNINVMTVNSGSVSISPGTVPLAGAPVEPGTDSSSTYSLSTNGTNMKITASLDQNMPEGSTLSATLEPPKSGSSPGAVALSITPATIVSGITRTFDRSRKITYMLTIGPGIKTSTFTRTITFTITP